MVEEKKAEEKSLDEKVEGEEKPNLEEIATRLANMQERHKMDQLLSTVMDSFVNYPGVKYKDDRGVEHYKTKFTAKEAKNIADRVFDKLAYHAHLRRYGNMTPQFFEELKKMRDPDGNPLVEAEVQRAFGITRTGLINFVLKNRENLTAEHFVKSVEKMLEHHVDYIGGQILSELTDEHKDYVADFIKKEVEKRGLNKDEYEIKNYYTMKQILPLYQKIAMNFYKKEKPKPEKPEEKS